MSRSEYHDERTTKQQRIEEETSYDTEREKECEESETGTQGLKNNYERSRIPSQLCIEIIKATEELNVKKS